MDKSNSEAKFKEVTEGILNVVKCFALIAAGIWTIHQWDKVIFPRETHEDFLRRVAERTDLQVSAASLTLSERIGDSSKARQHQVVVVRADLILENQTDFPVAVSGDDANFGILAVTAEIEGVADQIDIIEFGHSTYTELANYPVSFAELSGRTDGSHSIVEAGGKISLAIQKHVAINRQLPHDFITFSFQWNALLFAVNPITGSAQDGSPKRRHFSLSEDAYFRTDSTASDGQTAPLRTLAFRSASDFRFRSASAPVFDFPSSL
ncbi:MAG: hypothetical protein AAGA97_00985 [Pseudomonadota bacterium]